MVVKHVDSLTKIVEYLTRVSLDPISFGKKTYPTPSAFIISSLLFRRFECPDLCGGCCGRFTLDYFVEEEGPANKIKRDFTINGETIPVWSYMQGPDPAGVKKHCDFMNPLGRCTTHNYNPIHGKPNPFSCQIEPIKFISNKNKTYLIKRPFGRGWAMTKYDGTKGAICKFDCDNIEIDFSWNLRVLRTLDDIAKKFKLTTVLPAAIEYVETIQDMHKTNPTMEIKNFLLWDMKSGFNKPPHNRIKPLF